MRRGSQRNIFSRIFDRETSACPPSASVNRVRGFYQSIYPNKAVCGVDCPNVLFSRFTPDGRYLIGLPTGCQQLALYQYTGLSVCRSYRDAEDEPPPLDFDSFFTLKYQVPIVHGTEVLSQEFAILLNNGKHLLLASQTPAANAPDRPRPTGDGAIQPVETTTFHVVELATGKVVDVLQFQDDYLQLHFHACISVHDTLLAITTLYTQTIHIVQISASGALVPVRSIGRFCHDDDALTLHLHQDAAGPPPAPAPPAAPAAAAAGTPAAAAGPGSSSGNGVAAPQQPPRTQPLQAGTGRGGLGGGGGGPAGWGATRGPFVEGLWQRMLAYTFTCASRGVAVGQPLDRVQALAAGGGSGGGGGGGSSNGGAVGASAVRAQLGHFYQQFETYRKLFITRAQLLDRTHLLVNLSTHLPARGGDSQAGHQRNYFMVYNLLSTHVEAFFPDASEELGRVFLRHHDEFLALAAQTPWERYISTNLPMTRIRDSLARQDPLKNRPLTFRRALLSLPYAPQTRSPSPYLDPLLYLYNEKAMSQFHKTRQSPPALVKFTPRSRPNHTAFRITPAPAAPPGTQQVAMHYFHPFHPLVLTVVLSPNKPPVLNIQYHE